jgi:hypothetical protein
METGRQDSIDFDEGFLTSEHGLLGNEKIVRRMSIPKFLSMYWFCTLHFLIIVIYTGIFMSSMAKFQSGPFQGAGLVYSLNSSPSVHFKFH